jgi:transposase
VTSASQKNSNKRSNTIIKHTTFLGHLGIITSLFRELEVDKLIDEKFPKLKDHKVFHAKCILAMVLNGLGFVGQPLYLCPEYFKNISVERLFGNGIQKIHSSLNPMIQRWFNDYYNLNIWDSHPYLH